MGAPARAGRQLDMTVFTRLSKLMASAKLKRRCELPRPMSSQLNVIRRWCAGRCDTNRKFPGPAPQNHLSVQKAAQMIVQNQIWASW